MYHTGTLVRCCQQGFDGAVAKDSKQMAPEVFFTVCYNMSRPPPSLADEHSFHPAVLPGFSRRRVTLADYPGVIEQDGHVVRGTLATGLTEANIYRLDHFEGAEYERRKIKVRVQKQKGPGSDAVDADWAEVEANVYVFNNPARLEAREWDYEEFRREKLRKWSRADYVFDGKVPRWRPPGGFRVYVRLTSRRLRPRATRIGRRMRADDHKRIPRRA